MLWKTIARKMIVLFFCLLMLSGCVTSQDGTSVPTSADITQPIGNQSTDSQPTSSQAPTLDYHIPTVDENYWELLCENCDITMYLDNTRDNFLMFRLLATQDPTGKKITVTTDSGITSELVIYQAEALETIDFGIFMMYQDFNWASLETDIASQTSILKPWRIKYEAALSAISGLYVKRISIPLDFLGIDVTSDQSQQLKSLTVTLDGQTKTYDLGKVIFMPGKAAVNNSAEGGLAVNIPLISGAGTGINEPGNLKVPRLEFTVKKDVVLQGISFPGSERVKVASCDLVITTPFGDKFNMTWDGTSPIEVDEGSKIQVELTLADPALADTMIANAVRYICVDYTREGEPYGKVIYMSCSITVDPHAYYAWKVDGMDMRRYYYEYKYMMYRDNSETS